MPCEDRGRDWSDVSTGGEMSRVAGNPQKPGKSVEQMIISEPQKGTPCPNRAKTFILDFRPPKLWREYTSVESPSLWQFVTAAPKERVFGIGKEVWMLKGDSGDGSGGSTAEKVSHREHRVVDDQNLGRSTNAKGASGEIFKGKEEQIIWNWRKGRLCYKVAKNPTELCSFVRWETEFTSDKRGEI